MCKKFDKSNWNIIEVIWNGVGAESVPQHH